MAKLEQVILVVDLDKTICTERQDNETYSEVKPLEITKILNDLHDSGATIVIESARNMLTQNNDESKVIKNIGLTTLEWLRDNNIQYDGIKFGKTIGTCYIDDKALRPKEFIEIYNSLEDKSSLDELNKKIKDYLEERN